MKKYLYVFLLALLLFAHGSYGIPPIPPGGGVSGGTQYYIPYYTSATTIGSLASLGTAGWVLTSQGPGAAPIWAAASGGFSNPMTTLGDLIIENSTPAADRLPGNTTTTRKFLRQTGNGTISASPGWDTLQSGDIPSLNYQAPLTNPITLYGTYTVGHMAGFYGTNQIQDIGAIPTLSSLGAQSALTNPVTGPGSGCAVGHLATMGNTSGTTIADGGAIPTSLPPNGSASGDLSGSFPGPTVAKVNGGSVPVSKTVVGTNGSGQIIDASSATLSNNTSGTAGGLSGTPNITVGTLNALSFTSTAPNGSHYISASNTITPNYTSPTTGDIAYDTVSARWREYNGTDWTTNIVAWTSDTPSLTVYDYSHFPVDAGNDSLIAAPTAATSVQGQIGSQLLLNGSNAVWSQGGTPMNTLTVNVNHIDLTALVNTAGTAETAVSNSITTVSRKMYQLVATETHTSGAHIIVSGNGAFPTTTLAAGANTIYFLSTGTATVLTVGYGSNAGSNACTFTLYEYTRCAVGRDFSNATQQELAFDWMPPADWDAGTVYFQPTYVVDNATPPTNTQTIITQMSGFAVGTGDSMSQALGTAQTSTFTAGAGLAQYNEIIGAYSSAITIANTPTAGKKVKFFLQRPTGNGYAQSIALTGFTLKYGRTLAH